MNNNDTNEQNVKTNDTMTTEQIISQYRLFNGTTNDSVFEYINDTQYTSENLFYCPDDEQARFRVRLCESRVFVASTITATVGDATCGKSLTLYDMLMNVRLMSRDVAKKSRPIICATPMYRASGDDAYAQWDGFQCLDVDIKDGDLARRLKPLLFHRLHKYNWFVGIALSTSGNGLHVYTKIRMPDAFDDVAKRKLLFNVNFRHKYSFLFLAFKAVVNENALEIDDATIIKWIDVAMARPQQTVFVTSDDDVLVNTSFYEDFIYINFDNVADVGHPNVDWVTLPQLKPVFERANARERVDNVQINVTSKTRTFDTNNRVHYKHNERWRLANTLVKLYGVEQGYVYLRSITSTNINDIEIQSACRTAARHNKPVDTWAVNLLNTRHGFDIRLKIDGRPAVQQYDVNDVDKAVLGIDATQPNIEIVRASSEETMHLNANEYLGMIRHAIFNKNALHRMTLIESGAGTGKTEMVKQLVAVDKRRVMLIMPFVSTLQSKIEGDDAWDLCYGPHRVRSLDNNGRSIALTIDKFVKQVNTLELKEYGFDYLIVDESHLMFQSNYRSVMPDFVDKLQTCEIPVILMSGTPSGELLFFQNQLHHIRVVKDETRRKIVNVTLTNDENDNFNFMCRSMARDIDLGRKVFYPTNRGVEYEQRVRTTVEFFLRETFGHYDPINIKYYKKSQDGEQFMQQINAHQSICDIDLLMCSNYLSVGVDIKDDYEFAVYFDELWMPQEIEQFANRLRGRDLYIKLFLYKYNADGTSRNLQRVEPLNLSIDDEELRFCIALNQLCNDSLKRNENDYKYNAFVRAMLASERYIRYNDDEKRFYVYTTAYKIEKFEEKYRAYVEQLPVIIQTMRMYGYVVSQRDAGDFTLSPEQATMLAQAQCDARDEYKRAIIELTDEFINDELSETRMNTYRDVLSGQYEVKVGRNYKFDESRGVVYVKNIEIFQRVVSRFVAMSKMYDVDEIKQIFEFVRDDKRGYSYTTLDRLRQLMAISYNNKRNALDFPLSDFMTRVETFVHSKTTFKYNEVRSFCADFAVDYATRISTDEIIVTRSALMLQRLADVTQRVFDCLVEKTRSKRDTCKLKLVELLWTTREEKESQFDFENASRFVIDEYINMIHFNDTTTSTNVCATNEIDA